jgi:hypothetical protein
LAKAALDIQGIDARGLDGLAGRKATQAAYEHLGIDRNDAARHARLL